MITMKQRVSSDIAVARPDFEALGDKYRQEFTGKTFITEARRVELLKDLNAIGTKHKAVKKYTDQMVQAIAVNGLRAGIQVLIRLK